MSRRNLLWNLTLAVAVLALPAVSCMPGSSSGFPALPANGLEKGRAARFSGGTAEADDLAGSGEYGVFPAEVDGLCLVETFPEESALPLAQKFLGTEYRITGSKAYSFRGENEELVFWVTVTLDSEWEARDILVQMDRQISGSSYFYDNEQLTDEIVGEIYYARFKGKASPLEHSFYFQHEDRVFWVSMQAENPAELLQCFLKILEAPDFLAEPAG